MDRHPYLALAQPQLAGELGLGDRVRFTGCAAYDDVPELCLYRAHDVFSPTHAEGFSNTILKAMASGLAVVSCRSVGVVDCLLLAVSPHLDDAVFSIGATLAHHARVGWRAVVATVFTASVPDSQGFALACQADKGLGAELDHMALHRAEEEAACDAVGAGALHLPFAEAPHRVYGSAPALFANRRADDGVEADVAPALADLVGRVAPDRLLGPLTLGNHVDHLVVRSVLEGLGRPVEW